MLSNGTIPNATVMPAYHNTVMHQTSQQQFQQQQASTSDSTMNTIGGAAPFLMHNNNNQQQQQQQQWPPAVVASSGNNNTLLTQQQFQQQHMHNMQNQMIYRSQQQTPTNASMNGYPPCTSASLSFGPNPTAATVFDNGATAVGASVKKGTMKRKGANALSAADAHQQNAANSSLALNDAQLRPQQKKQALATGPAFSRPPQQQTPTPAAYPPSFVLQQQSPNLSSSNAPQRINTKFNHFVNYGSPTTNFINNSISSPPQHQQWSDAGSIKRPHSRSDQVRQELRNSVQARQNAATTSPQLQTQPISNQQENQAQYANNTYMANQIRLQQRQHVMMTTNFIPTNHNNIQNGHLSYEEKLIQQQQHQHQQQQLLHQNQLQHHHQQEQLMLQSQQQRNTPLRLFEDCRNNLNVSVNVFDLADDVFDFNLLNNSCEFDMDNVETQKLVQKLLS